MATGIDRIAEEALSLPADERLSLGACRETGAHRV